MWCRVILAVAAAAISLPAAEIDESVLRLLGTDVQWVVGANLERYRGTGLERFYRADLHWLKLGPSVDPDAAVRQVYGATGDSARSEVTVLLGTFLPAGEPAWHTGRGDYGAIVLGLNMALAGYQDAAVEAVKRWSAGGPVNAALASRLNRLNQSFDLWFLAVRPLEHAWGLARDPAFGPAKKLLDAVREVRGGIRLGGFYQLRLELEMRSPVEAAALAGIAPWLPGFLQLQRGWTREAALSGLLEDFDARASGSTVILTGTLDENKIRELIRKLDEEQRQREY